MIIDTVQIPSDVTLTIEPGVTITMPSEGDMFLLHGTISAAGTINNKIVFDGGGNSVIITTLGGAGNADFDYCIIRNGYRVWDRGGYFNLRHSEIMNFISDWSGYQFLKACICLESPSSNCNIEYNRFINTGGFYAYQAAGRICEIHIQYNLFHEMSSPISNAGGSPGRSEMLVKYNSFIDIEGIVLSLEPDFESTNMNATENYWGTLDTDIIDQNIYDGNDNIRVKNYIDYLPILTAPHPDTPLP